MPYSSVKSNRYHNKAVQESKRVFCCTTVASILKLTHQLQNITSETSSFLLICILPQAGHVSTFISPKMLQMKKLIEMAMVEEPLFPLSISFLSQEHRFGGGKMILLYFICCATFTQKFLRSGLRSWYEIHLYLSQEYCVNHR